MNKRILGPLLSVILIVGVGAAIYFSARDQLTLRQQVVVRGLIGSEKEDFFADAEVQQVLRSNGLDVQVEKAGSRQIATGYDLEEYDFAFPAGVPAAERLRREAGVSTNYNAFFTPMALASWRPIADILVANDLATNHGTYYTLDMAAYMRAVGEGTRWSDFQDNAAYDVNKRLLINSTDIRKSNSAAMYLALISYVANGENIVQNDDDAEAILPLVETVFLEQGFLENSSSAPFNDYLVMGMGKAPLVMIYESQYIAQAARGSTIRPDMVLIYPEPTIFTKHILVPLSETGERLGDLLENNERLQAKAIEYGFRTSDVAAFREFVSRNSLPVPETIVDVVEPPTYEVLEEMIRSIERRY